VRHLSISLTFKIERGRTIVFHLDVFWQWDIWGWE
jgi:hypothetical protein